MRGKPTDKRLANKAKAIVAKTGDVSLASEKTGVPQSTVYDLIDDEKFVEFRKKLEQEQIMKICKQTTSIVDLLDEKIRELTQEKLTTVRITELTRAIKDLRDTVREVKDNTINIEKAEFKVNWGNDGDRS